MHTEQTDLYEAIKKYDRAGVLALLKKNALSEIEDEQEREKLIADMIALKSHDIIKELEKQIKFFTAEMFRLDMTNYHNRTFMKEVFLKYGRKFDLGNKEMLPWLMKMACLSDCRQMAEKVLKTAEGNQYLCYLADADDHVFQAAKCVSVDYIPPEITIRFLVETAKQKDGVKRLRFLKRNGFNLRTMDIQENTPVSTLEQVLRQKPKNKAEIMQQNVCREALKRLKEAEEKEKIHFSGKEVKSFAAMLIILAVVAVGIWLAVHHDNKKDESADSSNQTSAGNESSADSSDTSEDSDTSGNTLSTDTSIAIKNGDTVNIDYVGTVDGVEFDGGNTNGTGTDLTIGSGQYIDDFEEQLIGAHVGDTVEVNVTFPDNYGNEELNGKDAVFEVVINGIYE